MKHQELISIIEIPMVEKKSMDSLIKALDPDNKLAPKGIVIDIQKESEYLKIIIKAKKSVELLTFRNTIDDLLEHIATLLKVLNTLAKKR